MKIHRWLALAATVGIVTSCVAGPALPARAASSAYTLFGAASFVPATNGAGFAVQLVSNNNAAVPYAGIDFAIPATLTFAQVQTLSLDYEFTDNSCGGGSPRFALDMGGGKHIVVYLGPYPNYTGCPMNTWTSTGNLVTTSPRVDTSQMPGGNFYDTWTHAESAYGSLIVHDLALVVDAGWFFASSDSTQTVLVDNININGNVLFFGCQVFSALVHGTQRLGVGVSSATGFPIHFITYSGGSGVGTFTARDAAITACSPPVEGGSGTVSATITGTVSSASTPSAFTPGDDISVSLSATNGVPGPATISDLDSGATYTMNSPYQFGSYLNLSTL